MRPRIACIMDKTDLDIVSTCSAWQCSFLLSHHGRHIKVICSTNLMCVPWFFWICSGFMVFHGCFKVFSWFFQGFFIVVHGFYVWQKSLCTLLGKPVTCLVVVVRWFPRLCWARWTNGCHAVATSKRTGSTTVRCVCCGLMVTLVFVYTTAEVYTLED